MFTPAAPLALGASRNSTWRPWSALERRRNAWPALPGDLPRRSRGGESRDRPTDGPLAADRPRHPGRVRPRWGRRPWPATSAQPEGPGLTPEGEQRILDTTLTTRPLAGTHWSVRTLATQLGLSRMMVHRVWQRHEIQPHRVEKFKLSTDPRFDEKVRDIVGLYLDPPERALVLCVDEKSQIQALDRTAPLLPLRPGFPERQTHDYRRYGTTTLFAAFNILTGKVIGTCHARHRGREFVKFLQHSEHEVPPELEIHLIVDNYSTHKSAAVQRWLKPKARRRFHFHFTPTSSWLNQVERWFGLITERMIRRGRSAASPSWSARSISGSPPGTRNPAPSYGPRPRTSFSKRFAGCKELAGTAH